MNFITSNSKIILIVAVAVIFLIGGAYNYFIKSELEKVQAEYSKQTKELAVEKANNTTLRASIENQNKAVEETKVDLEENLREFEEWKNQPVEVKYKEVIKYKEIKSNECEDIKNIINSIRSTSF